MGLYARCGTSSPTQSPQPHLSGNRGQDECIDRDGDSITNEPGPVDG